MPWAHFDDERQRGRDELLEFLTAEEPPGPDPEDELERETNARVAHVVSHAVTRADDELERRRSAQVYHDAGLPWTAEFEERVNAGEVDVS